jgi:hypothetical protein
MAHYTDALNQEYFNGRLSEACLAFLRQAPEGALAKDFVQRTFRWMKIARFSEKDFTARIAWLLGTVPRIFFQPDGRTRPIPQYTETGRHGRINDYLATSPWLDRTGPKRVLDLGCGFPPLTSVEMAKRFPEWSIIGADPSLGHYLVYDKSGDYATFDEAGRLRYFQPAESNFTHWDELFQDPEATARRFEDLLNSLLTLIPASDRKRHVEVQQNGARLIQNMLAQYERSNLRFERGGIGQVGIRDVNVIRCFNVLTFFDRAFRASALQWTASELPEQGVFICGQNLKRSALLRYVVYRKEGEEMVPKEFAFSLDHLRPLYLLPWISMHDDNYESNFLAEVIGTIRADDLFTASFDGYLDRLLYERAGLQRDSNGYLQDSSEGLSWETFIALHSAIEEEVDKAGFPQRAADILTRAGHRAWVNSVGHVAFEPSPSHAADTSVS